jgi:hypothetical protein
VGGSDAVLPMASPLCRELRAGDVGGEEVDAVAVEVATGAVVVLGVRGWACRARICASRRGTPASRALVMAAWRSECGLMCRGMPATFAIRATIRYASRRSIGLLDTGRSASGPLCARPGRLPAREGPGRSAAWWRACCLADQVQHPVAAQRLGVVLDPHRGGFGGTECVDAKQVSQRAVVDTDGLGDVEESDQLEPVQALGAGLVRMDLGDARIPPDRPR